MTEWKPIETAPKDGTKIDLWVRGKRIPDAYWIKSSDDPEFADWAVKTYDSHLCETVDSFVYSEPTHWMPLPEPPKQD